jgi:Glutathione S-transferase, C-terminal domain
MSGVYEVIGATGSPFSVKMRAIMRYRRIPHIWRTRHISMATELAPIKPPVMPYLRYPDGALRNDTTPLAYDLDARIRNGREIMPSDAATSFLSHLIEDMADELGTRIMAWYRWTNEADRALIGNWAAGEVFSGAPEEKLQEAAAGFRSRQVGRLDVIGAHADNGPAFEAVFEIVLKSLSTIASQPGYLFGSRPSLADFGWFGQLYECAMDPTAGMRIRSSAPRVFQWLMKLDDASGVEGEWTVNASNLPSAVEDLLGVAGSTYLPYLEANAKAAQTADELMRFSAPGGLIRQMPSKYQVKCLSWLVEEWRALPPTSKSALNDVLGDTGCLDHLNVH